MTKNVQGWIWCGERKGTRSEERETNEDRDEVNTAWG